MDNTRLKRFSISGEFNRIRILIVGVFAFVLITTIVLGSLQIRDDYNAIIALEERTARNLVRSVESNTHQVMTESRRILEGIGTLYREHLRLAPFDESYFHGILNEAVKGAAFMEALYVLDAEGLPIVSSNNFPLPD